MGNSISVKTWCKGYTEANSDIRRTKYLQDNLVTTYAYVPLDKKLFVINRLVQLTTHDIKNGATDLNTFKVNSVVRHVLYNLSLVDLYTNINVDFANSNQEYDYLKSSGAMDAILAKLPQSEVDEMKDLLDKAIEDAMTNEYENHAYFSKVINNITTTFVTLLSKDMGSLKDVLSSMTEGDISKLKDALTNTANMLGNK